ncbi:hypothetical protein [Ornithinimicrobium sufpigmenti]|uniref:hypothetical protein n=1 Tax=Ornithinimicrobium sufpigmenti TaxID=2508882 RepID=UPI00192D6E5C|nr:MULTISPECIES: hypothetical protein [unclassified Ornithinimicrobium]
MTEARQQRTVAQKMGVRAGTRAHVVGAPASALAAMSLPDLEVTDALDGEFDYLHLFVTRQEQLSAQFGTLRDRLGPGGMLWVSWPKGRRYGTDLTMRSVIAIG